MSRPPRSTSSNASPQTSTTSPATLHSATSTRSSTWQGSQSEVSSPYLSQTPIIRGQYLTKLQLMPDPNAPSNEVMKSPKTLTRHQNMFRPIHLYRRTPHPRRLFRTQRSHPHSHVRRDLCQRQDLLLLPKSLPRMYVSMVLQLHHQRDASTSHTDQYRTCIRGRR